MPTLEQSSWLNRVLGVRVDAGSRTSLPSDAGNARNAEHPTNAASIGDAAPEDRVSAAAPTKPEITVDPESVLIHPGTSVPFKATISYPDGVTAALTEVRWISSDPKAVSIDPDSGVAQAAAVSTKGPISITVVDKQTGKELGSASAEIAQPGAEPIPTKITIEPEAVALNRQARGDVEPPQQFFKATGFFGEGAPKVLTAKLEWKSSDDKIASVDGKGVATAGLKSGTATITATDLASVATGKPVRGTATVIVTVERERAVDTPFGRFSYFVDTETVVLPLLNKAVGSVVNARSMSASLNALDQQMLEWERKIPAPADVEAEIHQNTDRATSVEAATAKNSTKDLDLLKALLTLIQEEAESAAENVIIKQDDVTEASDRDRAKALQAEAEKSHTALTRFVAVVNTAVSATVSIATGNPVGLISTGASFAGTVVTELHKDDAGNVWAEDINRLLTEADDLHMKNAMKNLKLAQSHLRKMKQHVGELESKMKEYKEDDDRNWGKTEKNYDVLAEAAEKAGDKGKFRFANLRAAFPIVNQTRAYADVTSKALYGAREAVKALTRPYPSEVVQWMADRDADIKIIKAMFITATGLFDPAVKSRQYAEALSKRLDETYAVARKALQTAPGKDVPKKR